MGGTGSGTGEGAALECLGVPMAEDDPLEGLWEALELRPEDDRLLVLRLARSGSVGSVTVKQDVTTGLYLNVKCFLDFVSKSMLQYSSG